MTDLDQAVEFAIAHEIKWTRKPAQDSKDYGVHQNDPAPWNVPLGPLHPRGGVSGVIYVNGVEVKNFGEPTRSDQTFSVAKSYLALMTGKAIELGLIKGLDHAVSNCVQGIGFDTAHNQSITWRQLLNQTSEWEGTCFGIPDQVERYRHVVLDPKPVHGKKGEARPLQTPGTYWEYNDVRINQLSLALLHVFGESLSDVFKHYFLTPLGCSDEFVWEGYDNSWVNVQSKKTGLTERIQSLPGGTHWGGGVRVSARDQAKIAQLLLNNGQLNQDGQLVELLSSSYIKEMQTPCPVAHFYGLLTWLNPGRKTFPGASQQAFFMFGAGGNYVWIDPEYKAVVVTRWIDPLYYPKFTELVEQALFKS
jgi:CubicO group peptidase (beta-lactamase class C family)